MYPNPSSVNPPVVNRPAPSQQDIWAGEISTGTNAYPPAPQNQTAPPAPAGTTVLDMNHGLSEQVIGSPQSSDESYLGSLKAILSQNIGNHIVASFLMGSQNMTSWEGILHEVGNNYLTIYQPDKGRYVIGDFYSLKFAEFYEPSRSDAYIRQSQVAGWPMST